MDKTYRYLKIAIFILAFAVLMAGAWVLYNRLGSQVALPTETQAESQKAPDFTFYDGEGEAHKLSDYLGKPVILNFWASWCGPCKSEMPEIQKAYETYGQEIAFLIVDLPGGRETEEAAKSYIESQNYTFPVFFDNDMAGAMAYGIMGIPATFFLDAEGNVVTSIRQAMTGEFLQDAIDQILESK